MLLSVSWGCRIHKLHICRESPTTQLQMRPSVCHLKAEQFMIRVYKWSCDRQHSALVFIWIRLVIRDARLDQLAGHVKP